MPGWASGPAVGWVLAVGRPQPPGAMTFLEYLSVVRRRWLYVAVGLLSGLVAGYLTAPGTSSDPIGYQGTHTLLVNATGSDVNGVNLEQSALLASTGPVPVRVAERLATEGLPMPIKVTGEADTELKSLQVTATSRTSEAAARTADLTAEEINTELTSVDREAYDEQLAPLQEQESRLTSQLGPINQQLFVLELDDPARQPLLDQKDPLDAELGSLRSQIQELENEGPPDPPFRTLEAATGRRATAEGWRLPESRPARGLILGGLGLLLGAAGALAADRMDTRVRGKEDAERAFGLPVIAEIPPLGGGSKSRELLVATKPASPFVEAYRALRTVVLFAAQAADTNENGAASPGSNGDGRHAQVILVTSPSAGEGKTTTAAHLAAVLAEVDKRTLVISADFRRPRIHEYFGVPREPGLSDVLDTGAGRVRLSDLQMTTSFDGVHLMPSGGPVDNPAQLLTESVHLVAAARTLFDFIVIDTPPLLVANDATELAAEADMVILVAKADRTSRDASRRATEILRRVEAPLLGVVISAAHDTPTAYGYYRYRYYADTDQGAGAKRFGRKPQAAPATAPAAHTRPPVDIDRG